MFINITSYKILCKFLYEKKNRFYLFLFILFFSLAHFLSYFICKVITKNFNNLLQQIKQNLINYTSNEFIIYNQPVQNNANNNKKKKQCKNKIEIL